MQTFLSKHVGCFFWQALMVQAVLNINPLFQGLFRKRTFLFNVWQVWMSSPTPFLFLQHDSEVTAIVSFLCFMLLRKRMLFLYCLTGVEFLFFPRHFSFWVPICNTTQRLLPLSVSSVSCCWEDVCFFFIVWQVWNFFFFPTPFLILQHDSEVAAIVSFLCFMGCWEDVCFFFIVFQVWNFFFFPHHFSFCNTTQRLLPLSASSVSWVVEKTYAFSLLFDRCRISFFSHTISHFATRLRGCCHCQLPLFHVVEETYAFSLLFDRCGISFFFHTNSHFATRLRGCCHCQLPFHVVKKTYAFSLLFDSCGMSSPTPFLNLQHDSEVDVCFFFIVWQVWNVFSHTISQNAKLFRGCCHCQFPLFHELLRKHVLFAMTQLTEECCLLYFEENIAGCLSRKRVPFLFIFSLSALQSMKLSKLTHKDFHKVLKVVVASVWKKTLNQTFKTKCTKFI